MQTARLPRLVPADVIWRGIKTGTDARQAAAALDYARTRGHQRGEVVSPSGIRSNPQTLIIQPPHTHPHPPTAAACDTATMEQQMQSELQPGAACLGKKKKKKKQNSPNWKCGREFQELKHQLTPP